ncbi:MAG: PQQ-binding-like beta-propeller repeat protein [Tannerellaceae bacterium]|nr:PQQ-binding-like beta-propeller repeat protein [Tannerellaceae bacterium]
MKVLGFILGVLVAGIAAGCSHHSSFSGKDGSNSWPLFRGDASLSGYTSTRLPSEPVLLWSFKSDTRTVSSPIVYGSVTYWCDRRGKIRGVDQTGEQIFEYNLETAVEATPMIHDSVLYIGRIDGYMTALSLTQQDTLWTFETWGQISASPNITPFGDTEAVVFGSYDNLLYCVDTRTGKEFSSFESGYYLNGAAALWNNHVIFGGCDSWLRIIDTHTGVPTDSILLEAYIPASPAIWDNYCYVGDYSGNIYEIKLEKGKIAQHTTLRKAAGGDGFFVSVPALSADAVFALSDDRQLYAINRKDGSIRWKYLLKGNVGESSPVISYDKVIVCTKTGIVSILDARSGQLLWEYDTGEQIVGSPAVIQDHFYILTTRGTLFCFGNNPKK